MLCIHYIESQNKTRSQSKERCFLGLQSKHQQSYFFGSKYQNHLLVYTCHTSRSYFTLSQSNQQFQWTYYSDKTLHPDINLALDLTNNPDQTKTTRPIIHDINEQSTYPHVDENLVPEPQNLRRSNKYIHKPSHFLDYICSHSKKSAN